MNHNQPGKLTIYVGAAPGVGKTYRMLRDANDLLEKGIDVVVGLVEFHGRFDTAFQVGRLEVMPKRLVCYEGKTYDELDVSAVIARHPKIVLIDELAHTNVPGCEREKRYQDIQFILQNGIDVCTAVNIQHVESLRDKVEHITGVKVRERVPDAFIELADEIKLIDVTPETLQQRLEEGKIYAADKVAWALEHFFRLGNLTALREIALLEVADGVDRQLDQERKQDLSQGALEPAEGILVCVNYRPHSEKLIRRGWRIADRHHAKLYVLVVLPREDMTVEEMRDLERVRQLSLQFQATFITRKVGGHSIGDEIVTVARELAVSQIVIGQSPVGKGKKLKRFRTSPLDYVLANAEFVDLHVVAYGGQETMSSG